jgi:uncharacterized protein (UPF0262 family)
MRLENHNFDEVKSKSGPFYIGLSIIINKIILSNHKKEIQTNLTIE